MAERRDSPPQDEDFMQALMSARYKDGRALVDDEIAGILLTALFAGQHTSAVLAAWTGLELLRAPWYVARVRREMREVYAGDGTMSLAALKRQQILENAVRECERMHPPLILLIRKVVAASFPGSRRSRRHDAMVSPAVAHRLPDVFSDPERFFPDRFAPPASEDKRHQYALIGFGGGKHRCMGKNFAILQIKALWSVLLDRFHFTRGAPFPEPNYGSWVTGSKLPCRLHYRRRPRTTRVFR